MDTQTSGVDLTWDGVRQTLIPWMRADRNANLIYLGREYLGLLTLLYLAKVGVDLLDQETISSGLFLASASVLFFGIGVFQHRLSGLAHDGSHFVLFRNRLANDLISDIFLMFPMVAMIGKYRTEHLGHHQFVNDPDRDPDLIRLNHGHPQNFPISQRGFWSRYVLASFWPPTLLRYLFGRAKAANLSVGNPAIRSVYSTRVARSMRGAYWLTLLASVHLTGTWTIFWCFWIAPLLTVYPFLMQLREVAHHSNAPDDGEFTNSRVFDVHPLLKFCVFPYGQEFHLTHHLFARLPHYRLPKAHALLQNYPPYRKSVLTCRGYFFPKNGGPSLLELLSQPRGLRHVPPAADSTQIESPTGEMEQPGGCGRAA